MSALIYPNDQWTLELQELGFDKDAKELARMALLCRPPYAPCVAGRWGSGKTSVMRFASTYLGGMVASAPVHQGSGVHEDESYGGGREALRECGNQGALALPNLGFAPLVLPGRNGHGPRTTVPAPPERLPKSRVATVWFSPWKYQSDSNPMIPLLHSIREGFSAWTKVITTAKRAARALADAGLEALDHLIEAASSLFDLDTKVLRPLATLPAATRKAFARIGAEQLQTATDTERFNLLFEHAIGQLLGAVVAGESSEPDDHDPKKADHRLVIFIDDLDRCEGEAAIRLLEAIKLYLSTRYCVFVFGLDFPAVQQAITARWKDRPPCMAREYLDKLFQAVMHMPTSERYPLFVHNQLVRLGLLQEGKLEAGASLERASQLAGKIAAILEPNPRKVKNFLNGLALAWQVAGAARSGRELWSFAVEQRLKEVAPDTWTVLATHRPAAGELARFFAACAGGSSYPLGGAPASPALRVFFQDFGHLIQPPVEAERKAAGVELLPMAELALRAARAGADRALAKAWLEMPRPEVARPEVARPGAGSLPAAATARAEV